MRMLPLLLVVAVLACGCASPTNTLPPPPTLPATVDQPTAVPTDTPVPAKDTPVATAEPTDEATAKVPPSVPLGASEATELSQKRAEERSPVKLLEVEFVNPLYECVMATMNDFGDRACLKRFSVLMKVRNVSSNLTLAGGDYGGWKPSRWVIEDGTTTRDGPIMQEANHEDGGPFFPLRPDIAPGGEAEFTWMTANLQTGQWVSAIEYVDEWGKLYRQDFPRPEGGEFNYVECGGPKEGDC